MLMVIRSNILEFIQLYWKQAAVFTMLMYAVSLVMETIAAKRRMRKGRVLSFGRRLVLILLYFYIYLVIAITLLSRSETYTAVVNLKLFGTFRKDFISQLYLYENILLFVPLSVLLYALAKPFRRLDVLLTIGIGASLLIELSQYVTHWGRFEVDDILTNNIGILLGAALAWIISSMNHLFRKFLKNSKCRRVSKYVGGKERMPK